MCVSTTAGRGGRAFASTGAGKLDTTESSAAMQRTGLNMRERCLTACNCTSGCCDASEEAAGLVWTVFETLSTLANIVT